MKKWNKFSLFVRTPSTYLKHRSYFTSLITFRQRIMGSERAERITLQHKEKLQLQVKGTSQNKSRLQFFQKQIQQYQLNISFQKIIISIALKTVGFAILKNLINTLCVELTHCVQQIRVQDFLWSEFIIFGTTWRLGKAQAYVFLSCICIYKVKILYFGQKYVYFGSKFVKVTITTDKVLFSYQLYAADT